VIDHRPQTLRFEVSRPDRTHIYVWSVLSGIPYERGVSISAQSTSTLSVIIMFDVNWEWKSVIVAYHFQKINSFKTRNSRCKKRYYVNDVAWSWDCDVKRFLPVHYCQIIYTRTMNCRLNINNVNGEDVKLCFIGLRVIFEISLCLDSLIRQIIHSWIIWKERRKR